MSGREANMHNILVAVLGHTPAILTEAFYYYAKRKQPPVAFSEVHVLTTTVGRDAVLEKLLGHRKGNDHFYELLRHLGINPTVVSFDDNHIHVFRDSLGRELADVRTSEECVCAADRICEVLFQLCSRSDAAVYATIAGGRKSLGVFLTIGLQLYARPQDRLFHVLVDPRIEADRNVESEFFFPSKPLLLNGKRLPLQEIRIDCDEIPLLCWPWDNISQIAPTMATSQVRRSFPGRKRSPTSTTRRIQKN
jgi:CRISPR-associated protein (TIGR02584 family)